MHNSMLVLQIWPNVADKKREPKIEKKEIIRQCQILRGTTKLLQVPSGSTCLAICRASEVAKSVLAGVTAKIRHVSLEINWNSMSLIWASMSTGWSPTGTFVSPGKSIIVMFRTMDDNYNVQHNRQILTRHFGVNFEIQNYIFTNYRRAKKNVDQILRMGFSKKKEIFHSWYP